MNMKVDVVGVAQDDGMYRYYDPETKSMGTLWSDKPLSRFQLTREQLIEAVKYRAERYSHLQGFWVFGKYNPDTGQIDEVRR